MSKPQAAPGWTQCTPPSRFSGRAAEDIVSIKNLQLPSGTPCPTIFHEIKPQPAYISVSIHLRQSFASAASADKLDESTVHYGNLAKRIRSACGAEAEQGGERTLATALAQAEDMAGSRAERVEVELICPKGSAYGGVLGLRERKGWDEKGEEDLREMAFVAKGLRVMVLVGVNASERTARQALVVDCEIDLCLASQSSLQDCKRLFPFERVLCEMIEKTEFETLETLADFCVKGLKDALAERDISAFAVHLKFEKPAAIPWADGPVIEVYRSIG